MHDSSPPMVDTDAPDPTPASAAAPSDRADSSTDRTPAGEPGSDDATGVGGSSEPEPSAEKRPGRVAYAKVQEAEHLVSGRTRWSVGATRRYCYQCQQHLPEHETFHTALCPVDPTLVGGDASSAFERRDYCEKCFDSAVTDQAFAHWKTILPPPPDAPRKVVNLASLRVYFDQLTELIEASEGARARRGGDEREEDDRTGDGAADPGPAADDAEAESPADDRVEGESTTVEAAGSDDADFGELDLEGDQEPSAQSRYAAQWSEGEERPELWVPLRYLLGLFLVRKRVLKWEGVTDSELTLRCKQSEREYRVEIPPRGKRLEEAESAFEAIFS